MQVEIIRTESELQRLEPTWNTVLDASYTDLIFLTFEWLSTWWRHFGKAHELFVIVVKDHAEILGIAPLMISLRDGFRLLQTLGSSSMDYVDFIIVDKCSRESVMEAIFRTIASNESWDFFVLDGIHKESSSVDLIQKVVSRIPRYSTSISDSQVSIYVPIDKSWDSYWRTLKSGFRKNSKRQIRRLREQEATVVYERATTPSTIALYMQELITHHLLRWKDADDLFKRPVARSFLRDVAQRFATKQWLNLSVMLVNGQTAAIEFGFEYAGRYYSYANVHVEQFATYSVGRLLTLHVIEDVFSRGLAEFDLLVGDESYKFDFNPNIRQLLSFQMCRPGLRSRIAWNWFRSVRPKLEDAVRTKTYLRRMNWWLLERGLRK
jgi:CelD/BcsL family acetyltransferase involved in cellulose biosynthesis